MRLFVVIAYAMAVLSACGGGTEDPQESSMPVRCDAQSKCT